MSILQLFLFLSLGKIVIQWLDIFTSDLSVVNGVSLSLAIYACRSRVKVPPRSPLVSRKGKPCCYVHLFIDI